MEHFGLVEADFQQYYHLDISRVVGFCRYARLLINLPSDSRVMTRLNPPGSWSWSDETNSRILHKLSVINSNLCNANRKSTSKPLKPDEFFEPKYVKKAKEKELKRRELLAKQKENIELTRNFWQSRNPDVKMA